MENLSRQHCFDECTFVIFGATGDLTKRKLIPAIYKLIEDNRLCTFALVGVAIDESNVDKIFERARPFIPNYKPDIAKKLLSAFRYYKMDFRDKDAYQGLHETLSSIENSNNLAGNRIFYFATMPEHFTIITQNLVENDIVKNHNNHTKPSSKPWSRVVYEKPFGNDLASSKKINEYLARVFDESQVFRIDHYLGKELVGNIALARFTNRIFEPLWNKQHIEAVYITLSETIGIEKRGAFYDACGAIKDMVQSHMLQLLALVTMETPNKLSAEHIRNAKAAVLKDISVNQIIKGQYEGYHQEPFVKPNSITETFAALKLNINNDRWRNVPFYLKTGKFLHEKASRIYIKFKHAECLLDICPSQSNAIIIKIHPEEGFYLQINTKIPDGAQEVIPITMELPHSRVLRPNSPEAYEVLLADIIKGDQSAFIRADEVESSWNIVDMASTITPATLYSYKRGSSGPEELNLLNNNQPFEWY